MKTKRPVIAVIGSANPSPYSEELAFDVGRLIGEGGGVLVTGGLGGVMTAASRGCAEAGGLVIGILPGSDPSAANPFVDVAIPSGMGHARNILVAQSAGALIVVEGGLGTLSEAAIGLKTGRRVFCLNSNLQVDGIEAVAEPQQAVRAAFAAIKEGVNGS